MTQHLVHVKDLEALFRESSGSDLLRKKHFCPVCKLYRTATNKKMLKHYKQCRNPNYFKKLYAPSENVDLPDGNLIKPPNSYKTSVPVLRGFFDFETLHRKKTNEKCEICIKKLKNLGCVKEIMIYCEHKNKNQTINCSELPAICFSLILINQKNETVFEYLYSGIDSAEHFTNLLLEKEEKCVRYIDRNMKMHMTEKNKFDFFSSDRCEECKEYFSDVIKKCRDHDHFTGKYRAALCNFCNLQKKT